MQRQKIAELLQQFFVLSVTVKKELLYRKDNTLVINLQDVSPFCLFTSILNSLGQDPVSSLSKIQELIDEFCFFLIF